MTTKNAFSRELMHKSIGSVRYVGGGSDPFDQPLESPEYASRIRTFDRNEYFPENKQDNDRADSIREKRTAAKKRGGSTSVYDKQLANHEWYIHNKRWKQDYNRDYYERNKDYWVQRYRAMKGAVDQDVDFQKRTVGKMASGDWTAGEGVALIRRNAEGNQAYDRAELESARINAKRAMEEYKWFMDAHKKMKVTEAWSDGAKMIRDAGKNFLSKFGLKRKVAGSTTNVTDRRSVS